MKIKKFFVFFLTLIMVLHAPKNIYAQVQNDWLIPVSQSFDESKTTRVPNGITVNVTARQNGTGVDVYVGNIGIDGLDNVTVTATATGHAASKTQTGYVPMIIGKNFGFDFPFTKCNTTYNVTVRVVDGSGTSNLTGKATLEYTDTILSNAGWHRGTFPTRAASLEYHFNTHGSEVSSTNLVDYLNKATTYRSEIINNISKGTASSVYTITKGTGSIASKKYKHKTDLRFAILTDSGNYILSFGK